MANPLLSDRFIDFLLDDVLAVERLCALPYFSEHSRDTFQPFLAACRRLAREKLFPHYRAMDAEGCALVDGRVRTHARMPALWEELKGLGILNAGRPAAVGGQQLPLTVASLGSAYLMAGNLAAYAFAGLTSGAGHLLEAFGSAELKATYLEKLYDGTWSGTMALTEPHAGSSLGDLTTRATPTAAGHHLIKGAKIFISGGDNGFTQNVVHLVLARLDGAPDGTRGISLFCVPRLRPEGGALVPNDVQVSGLIHKIGWRALPSVALALGDEGDCRGWLVGPANQGLKCMFQMMNEARLMVGANAAATASVAFHESLAYAQERRQGRAPGRSEGGPVPLVEHADVRRMLLRQKAIVEGSLALLGFTARAADLSEHAQEPAERERQRLLLDLLTPIAKTFPSEAGFEVTALAVQVHGGYGYSSEYLPEALLRDQKLNSIHEGTTAIQGLDLLGRKVVAGGGAALAVLREAIGDTVAQARAKGVEASLVEPVEQAADRLVSLVANLGARGAAGDLEGMLGHSADFLELASTVVVGWMWLMLASASAGRGDDFAKGLLQAARYWAAHELSRVPALAALCEGEDRSHLDVKAAWLA